MDDTSAFERLPGRRYYHPLSFGPGESGGGSARGHPDDLIWDAYAGGRRLTGDEFRRVVDHVANAGFDPGGMRRVRRRLEGIPWKGRVLKTGQGQRLLTSEEHYLTHAYAFGEWPEGTSEQRYYGSIEEVIRDPRSRFFVGLYRGELQLTNFVRRSGNMKGPQGHEYVLVDYRVATGHWMTAMQPRGGIGALLRGPQRSNVRWLPKPT